MTLQYFHFLSAMLHRESSMKQIKLGQRMAMTINSDMVLISTRHGVKCSACVKPFRPHSSHLKQVSVCEARDVG